MKEAPGFRAAGRRPRGEAALCPQACAEASSQLSRAVSVMVTSPVRGQVLTASGPRP